MHALSSHTHTPWCIWVRAGPHSSSPPSPRPPRPGAYHVISRCVRRAFLCGDQAERRRAWVRDLIRQAAAAFAVDVLACAVMSNHLHLVVLTDPSRVIAWTRAEVATRWASAHPRAGPDGCLVVWSDTESTEKAADQTWVETIRKRLPSLSWFLKNVKERLARRAIAANLGFCYRHYFNRVFISLRGTSPAAYRCTAQRS